MKHCFVCVAILLAFMVSGCSNPCSEDLRIKKDDRADDVDIHVNSGRRSVDQSEVLAVLRSLSGQVGQVDTKVESISNRVGVVEQRITNLENAAAAPAQSQQQMPLEASLVAATHLLQVREVLGIKAQEERIDELDEWRTQQTIDNERQRADEERRRADEAEDRANAAELQLKVINGRAYVEQHRHHSSSCGCVDCCSLDPVCASLREYYHTESAWHGHFHSDRY